jgi:hypothetical protein
MAVPTFPTRKDADLLTWSANFDALVTAGAATYGLTEAQAAAYAALHTAYATAHATATNPNTNSKANINAKNQAKQQLLSGPGGAWELVNIVQAFPDTTNAMRGQLGLRIPDSEPSPVPAPATAPDLSILATMARIIKVRLRDQDAPSSRGKPQGVQGATVLYHVGEEAPADPSQWIFALNTSKTLMDVQIPASVTAGSKVWLTAFWFNARKQSSPAALPESTRVSDGMAQAA